MLASSDTPSLLFHLEQMGFANEAHYFQELANVKPDTDAIPSFATQPSPNDDEDLNQELIAWTLGQRRSDFKQVMIVEDDYDALVDHIPDKEAVSIDSIDFAAVEEALGKEKYEFLFSNEAKRHFVSFGLFCGRRFLDFISILIHVQRAVWLLLALDPMISDSVHESTLQKMVQKYVRHVESLVRLTADLKDYVQFYVPTVVSRIRFFLGGTWNGRFNLQQLITSKSFIQFVHMDDMDLESNPFAIQNTTSLYNLYVTLDKNKEGMLSQSDLKVIDADWAKYRLSDAFLSRLFSCLPTFDGCIDFMLFLYVMWPLRYMGQPQAARFFCEIFDLDEDGRVGIQDVRYFYKSIYGSNNTTVTFDWFVSEIYDMCQCRDEGFNEEMLIASGEQEEIIRRLIDKMDQDD